MESVLRGPHHVLKAPPQVQMTSAINQGGTFALNLVRINGLCLNADSPPASVQTWGAARGRDGGAEGGLETGRNYRL